MTDAIYVLAASTTYASIPAELGISESGSLPHSMVPVRDHVALALNDLCYKVAPAGLDSAVSCFIGACGWTGYFGAEQIIRTVDEYGWKWIDPEAFLYYSPHSAAASICVQHGLRGEVRTLLGPEAHRQALALGVARCASGDGPTLVIGIYSAASAEGVRVRCHGVLLSARGELMPSAYPRDALPLADLLSLSDLSLAAALGLAPWAPADGEEEKT